MQRVGTGTMALWHMPARSPQAGAWPDEEVMVSRGLLSGYLTELVHRDLQLLFLRERPIACFLLKACSDFS